MNISRIPRMLLAVAAVLVFGVLGRPTLSATAPDGSEAVAVTPSRAWVTSYDDGGGLSDIATVTCGGESGYQTELSSYVGTVVDVAANSYVLNWRPYVLGRDNQLCGLRVAYRLPDGGGGFAPQFSYFHVGGTTLRPRASDVEWSFDSSGGCLCATVGNPLRVFNINLDIPDGSRIDYLRIYCYRGVRVFLPLVLK